jgi:hypothetical protein
MSTADPQSFNRYTYCSNDPVNNSDQFGLEFWDTDSSDASHGFAGWGGDVRFNDSHFGGPGIVNQALARHNYAVNNDRWGGKYSDPTPYDGFVRNVHFDIWYEIYEDESIKTDFQISIDNQGHATSSSFRGDSDIDPFTEPLNAGMDQGTRNYLQYRNLGIISNLVGGRLNYNWSIKPGKLGYETIGSNLRAFGCGEYLDVHPDHWGGDNYECLVRGTWYHVVIGRPDGSPFQPATFIQAFTQDGFFRPSGLHRVDWATGGAVSNPHPVITGPTLVFGQW